MKNEQKQDIHAIKASLERGMQDAAKAFLALKGMVF